jgi:hypothetical protein
MTQFQEIVRGFKGLLVNFCRLEKMPVKKCESQERSLAYSFD